MFAFLVACSMSAEPTMPSVDDALAAIRAAEPPCMGPMASVTAWRTPDGQLHRLFYMGDLGECSHPPAIWFDAAGKELETVPDEPVTDENRAHYEGIRERHTKGATEAERLRL